MALVIKRSDYNLTKARKMSLSRCFILILCNNKAADANGSSAMKVTTRTFCGLALNSLTWLPVELHIKVTLRVVLHPHRDQILRDLKGRNSPKTKAFKKQNKYRVISLTYPLSPYTHIHTHAHTLLRRIECAAEQCRDQIICRRIEIERGGEQTTGVVGERDAYREITSRQQCSVKQSPS